MAWDGSILTKVREVRNQFDPKTKFVLPNRVTYHVVPRVLSWPMIGLEEGFQMIDGGFGHVFLNRTSKSHRRALVVLVDG